MAEQIKQVKIKVQSNPGEVTGAYLIPDKMQAFILLAHGAGAGMHHPFMVDLATALGKLQIGSLRFNLPYMEAGKKFPGSPKHSIEGIQSALDHAREFTKNETPIFLAGKSYGGRMSSHLAENLENNTIAGLIYYGFPLHAPGKPDVKRASHLVNIDIPMLFLQGSNDNLADQTLLNQVTLELDLATVTYYDHADHSFKRPKKISKESLIPQLAKDTSEWIDQVS
ncbi:MAG: alpha/beta family hydrolase [Fulvivirga sp.]